MNFSIVFISRLSVVSAQWFYQQIHHQHRKRVNDQEKIHHRVEAVHRCNKCRNNSNHPNNHPNNLRNGKKHTHSPYFLYFFSSNKFKQIADKLQKGWSFSLLSPAHTFHICNIYNISQLQFQSNCRWFKEKIKHSTHKSGKSNRNSHFKKIFFKKNSNLSLFASLNEHKKSQQNCIRSTTTKKNLVLIWFCRQRAEKKKTNNYYWFENNRISCLV